jgi:hypothetical protein
MRTTLALSALLVSGSLAALCQGPTINVNIPAPCPQQCPNVTAKPKVITIVKHDLAPPTQPPAAPIIVTTPAPPITVNSQATDLTPLAAGLLGLANAKMNETHVLENLGDVGSDHRADLATRFAEARIKQMEAQAALTTSQADMNRAEAKFTDTKRHWYGAGIIINAVASVAGADLGATRINSTITQQGASTGPTTLTANPTTSVTGPTVTQNANPTMTGPTVTTNQTASPVTNVAGPTVNTNVAGSTVSLNNVGNAKSTADPKVTAVAVASQQQGQSMSQNQGQNQGQGQTAPPPQVPPPPPSGGGGKPICHSKSGR